MKKVFIAMALLVAGITVASAATTYTARVTISAGTANVKVREAATLSDARENAYDIPFYGEFGIFVNAALDGFNEWSQWGSNDISNVALGIMQSSAADVTLTFSDVIGDNLKLSIDGTEVDIVDGGSATLLAADFIDNGAGKFVYSKALSIKKAAAPVAKQFCFRENTLFIDGYNGDNTVTIDGTAVVIDSDHFTRAFTQAEAGRHTLHIDGQDYLFDAFPAVTKKN